MPPSGHRGRTLAVMALVAKALLVLVTLVFLASMGGGMLFAAPFLVPLHWLAARRSGPYGAGGWTFLAAASVFEYTWMLAFVATDAEVPAALVGAAAALGTIVVFLRRAAARQALATPR